MLETTSNIKERWQLLHMIVLDAGAGDPKAQGYVKDLETGDAFSRYWSLQACHFHKDWLVTKRLLNDPVYEIRHLARALFCRYAPQDELIQVMKELRPRLIKRFLVWLRKFRRREVIDQYFRSLSAETIKLGLLTELIPFASLELVKAHWHIIKDSMSETFWRRMAAFHSDQMVEFLRNVIHLPDWNFSRSYQVSTTFRYLCECIPDQAIVMLDELVKSTLMWNWLQSLPRDRVGKLLVKYPDRLPSLVSKCIDESQIKILCSVFYHVQLDDVVEHLPPSCLEWILRYYPRCLSDVGIESYRWLSRLNGQLQSQLWSIHQKCGQAFWGGHLLHISEVEDADKEAFYQRWSIANRHENGVISREKIKCLPEKWRRLEVERHFNQVPYLESREAERLSYANLLHYQEAKEHLKPMLQHPDGDKRAAAWEILIASCNLYPEEATLLMQDLLLKKNEQDPVRRRILGEIIKLRFKALNKMSVKDLQLLIHSYLQASDLSPESIFCIGMLLNRVYPFNPSWATDQWVALLKKQPRSIGAFRVLCYGLRASQISGFLKSFAGVLRNWRTFGRRDCITALALVVKKHLKQHPELGSMLEDSLTDSGPAHECNLVLEILLRHDPPRFEAIVKKIVASDQSILLLPVVLSWVSRQHQEYLAIILAPEPLRGRWSENRLKVIPKLNGPFSTWTMQQQELYRDLLMQVLEGERPDPEITIWFEIAPQFCFLSHEKLASNVNDPRPLVQELAARALGSTAHLSLLPFLLELLEGHLARFVIYSLRKMLSECGEAEVIARLERVQFKGVTVAKEVCRLLGEFGGQNSIPLLLKWASESKHRDIFIAIIRALWDHLYDQRVWDFLFDAAARGQPQFVSRLATMPQAMIGQEIDAKFARLTVELLNRRELSVRLEVLNELLHSPLQDHQRIVHAKLVELINSENLLESKQALLIALRKLREGEAEATAHAFVKMCHTHQKTLILLDTLTTTIRGFSHEPGIRFGTQVLSAFQDEEIFAPQVLSLARACHLNTEIWYKLAARNLLDFDCLNRLQAWLENLADPGKEEEKLRFSPHRLMRWLGLSALRLQVQRSGWTEAALSILAIYQNDRDIAIRREALAIFPERKE